MGPIKLACLSLLFGGLVVATSRTDSYAAPIKLDPGQVNCNCKCSSGGNTTYTDQVIEGRVGDCRKLNGNRCYISTSPGVRVYGETSNCLAVIGQGGVVSPKVSDSGVDATGGVRPPRPTRVTPKDTGVGQTTAPTRDPG